MESVLGGTKRFVLPLPAPAPWLLFDGGRERRVTLPTSLQGFRTAGGDQVSQDCLEDSGLLGAYILAGHNLPPTQPLISLLLLSHWPKVGSFLTCHGAWKLTCHGASASYRTGN